MRAKHHDRCQVTEGGRHCHLRKPNRRLTCRSGRLPLGPAARFWRNVRCEPCSNVLARVLQRILRPSAESGRRVMLAIASVRDLARRSDAPSSRRYRTRHPVIIPVVRGLCRARGYADRRQLPFQRPRPSGGCPPPTPNDPDPPHGGSIFGRPQGVKIQPALDSRRHELRSTAEWSSCPMPALRGEWSPEDTALPSAIARIWRS